MTSLPLPVEARFTDWQSLGTLTFTPDDTDRVVGSFSLAEGQDTIWLKVQSLTAPEPWPWSYGILGWKTSQGYELGSCKAYSDEAGQVYRLGVGRPPSVRDGIVTFEPRGFNLAWVKQGNPWTLKFECSAGSSSTSSGGGLRGVAGGLVDTADNGLSLVRVNFQ